jgi:hypothetical protein
MFDMATNISSIPVVIKRHSLFSLLAFLLATLVFAHPVHSAHTSGGASIDIIHHSLAKSTPAVDMNDDDTKKSKPGTRYIGAPPGLHYLPMLAMFFFTMMLVFENNEKSRELLFLPVLFSFLAYKILFLMEENAAIDGYLRKMRK